MFKGKTAIVTGAAVGIGRAVPFTQGGLDSALVIFIFLSGFTWPDYRTP